MALSKPSHISREEYDTQLTGLLKEIITLMNNPDQGKKTLVELIGLSQDELKKVSDARAFLSNHAKIVDEINKLKSEATALMAEAEDKMKSATKLASDNDKKKHELEKFEYSLRENKKTMDAEFAKRSQIHANERQQLDTQKSHLEKLNTTVSEKHAANIKLDNELKERARKLRLAVDAI